MVKYIIYYSIYFLFFFNINFILKAENISKEIFFDVVQKDIIIENKFPNDLNKIINTWFDNKIKVNGFDGSLILTLSNYIENITIIEKGKKIDLSLDFYLEINKRSLSKKDTFSGVLRANSKITGNFTLNEFDELLLSSQYKLISILGDKLSSIN